VPDDPPTHTTRPHAAAADVRGRLARRDANLRLAAGMLLWASLLVVCYLWVAGGNVQQLTGWPDGLTSAGRLLGLVASDLLLVQVLLMARVPVLEGAFGQDWLALLHRWVGFTSFDLMLAHIVLVTWGYAAGSPSGFVRTLWQLTRDYPGMLLAVAGSTALVAVTVTSIRWARRRLRYESWHLLHLYAYLGVGLALPHQLWSGQDFGSSVATAYWWTVWALTAAAVVGCRVVLPLWRSARHGLRVTSVVREAPGIVSVYLTGRRLDRLRAHAGQFFVWRFLGRAGWTRGHPFSLSSAPDGRSLRITVKALGDGSTTLPEVRPGARALVEGPFGRLSPRVRTRDRVLLLGAGVGVTPLRALAEELDYGWGDALLVQRSGGRPLFARELEALAAERGLGLLALPGPRRDGSWLPRGAHPGDDLSALLDWVPDVAERDVYVCGPDEWTAAVRRTLQAAGTPAGQVHVESFRW
jgi:predicted ferric reductase